MPDVVVREHTGVNDRLARVENVVYLFAADSVPVRQFLVLHPRRVLRAVQDHGATTDVMSQIHLTWPVVIIDAVGSPDYVTLSQPVAAPVPALMIDSAASSEVVSWLPPAWVLITDAGVLVSDRARLTSPIPVVRAATLDEVPGTVNLHRNPSVERDLTDWAATGGVT